MVDTAVGDGASPRPAGTPALLVDGLAKTFNGKRVLHPFELRVQPGEIHALLGQNGSGKSTLIKLLAGFHEPDAGGRAEVGGQQLDLGSPAAAKAVGLRFVHQELGLVGNCSVLDNLTYGSTYPTRFGTIRGRKLLENCRRALDAAGLDVDPRVDVSTLSPAQRTGVAVARAMAGEGAAGTVLVLDEPTATLPAEEVQHLHRMLRAAARTGVGILYVTHHLDEVFELATRVSVLRDGYLVASGPVAELDRETLVERLIGGELQQVQRVHQDTAGPSGMGPASLEVRNLRAGLLRDLSFDARPGEIVGVFGITGSGRESLLGAIFGAVRRESGTVTVAGKAIPSGRPDTAIAKGLGYVPPDRKTSGAVMSLSARENFTLSDLKPFWRKGSLSSKLERAETRDWFERLQVRPAGAFESPLASFSGGNAQKIVLGKWLRLGPKVLLLDDPTQGVDVGAKAELHRQILHASEAGTTMILCSSDVEELASICDRVLVLSGGVLGEELIGDSVTEDRINRSMHSATTTLEGSR